MSFSNLRAMLIRHEGIRLKAYKDTEGKLSIGVGRNIEELGITQLEALMMLDNDIKRVVNEAADKFDWYKSMNIPRQDVLLSMLFNLGMPKLLEFKAMLSALSFQNYEKAADEMLNSAWANQVGERATELATVMRRGVYPIV